MQSSHLSRRMEWRYRRCNRRYAFSLLQIVAVVGLLTIVAMILFPALGRARASARRAQCDTRLKAIALALNSYRQEQGTYPAQLSALTTDNYFTDALRCPADPRANASYEEFYVLRAKRDRAGLPLLLCPFHERHGSHGSQVYVDSYAYTKQFATRPATLIQANNVTLLRPGQNPVAAAAGMALHGGDRLQTGSAGAGTIRFADNSEAALAGGTEVTVLQSFIDEMSDAPLYSLVRQQKGEVTYKVTHGSKFDIVTPTTTAGALGTEFKIVVASNGDTSIDVISGKVFVTTLQRTAQLQGTLNNILPSLPGLPDLPLLPGL